MLDFTRTILDKIIIHKVGNKSRPDDFQFSENTLQLDESIEQVLGKYFLSPFKNPTFYRLFHDSDLRFNEVYTYVNQIFEFPDDFVEQSRRIAKHLFEKSDHPKIKGGELYVVSLKDCVVGEEICEAIGIFKSENKETYLKVFEKNKNLELNYEKGINISKLDKGCLIFNTEAEQGYKVCLLDLTNQQEAQYWKQDFLRVRHLEDAYNFTNQYLQMCRQFVDEICVPDNQVPKNEQVILKNKTIDYFQKNDTFVEAEFENDVFENPQQVDQFQYYKQNFGQIHEFEMPSDFEISTQAVKKAKSKFKGVIRLDKNFEIHVNAHTDLLEKGYDNDRKLHYYVLYFEEEL